MLREGEEWEEELLAYTEAQLYWHAPKHRVILAEQPGAKMNVLLHGMDSEESHLTSEKAWFCLISTAAAVVWAAE